MKTSGTHSYLNFATNILVAIVATSLIGLLGYRAFFQKLNSAEAPLLKAGDAFEGVQEINFSKSRNTVLLALDTKCSYCDLSIPFYQKLIIKSNQSSGTRIIALFDNSKAEVEDYLQKHELDVEFIANTSLVIARVDLTPTVVLVTTNRIIAASYEGMLPEKQEHDLLETIEKIPSTEGVE